MSHAIRKLSIVAVSIASSAMMSGAAFAGCKSYSSTSAGLIADLAKATAAADLDLSLTLQGLKAKGGISYACKKPDVLTECTASRTACK